MSQESYIRVRGLSVGWDGQALLRNLDFDVREGSCFAILGGSGAGKSTLMRFLIGLELPMAGEILIRGIGEPSAHIGKPGFGVMFQAGALFGSRNLFENLALPLRAWTDLSEATIQTLVQAKLDLVDLGPYADYLPEEISGGMKKRAAIARALILEPDLLFLDEPSAGLDPITSVELDDLMRNLTQELGITLVLVSHELPSILSVADDCILLDKESGGIIARGDPDELKKENQIPMVHDFFNRSSPKQVPSGEVMG
jgi:phospholipid/cholesterol/gamma-HCH transport system ATP-binding protein